MAYDLVSLPPEILFQVICRLDHQDVLSFGRTCHAACSATTPDNHLLWQAVFLQKFDDPRDRWNSLTKSVRANLREREKSFHWFTELRRRMTALNYIAAEKLAFDDKDDPEAEGVIETLLDILDTAKSTLTTEDIRAGKEARVDDRYLGLNLNLLPSNWQFTTQFDGLVRGIPASTVRRNLDFSQYGSDSSATSMPGSWETSRAPGRPLTRSQASLELDKIVRSDAGSRLHVLCGLTELENQDERFLGRARRITYDWSFTNVDTEYGPFKKDGNVDWRRLEAISSVVSRQFNLAVRGRMTPPLGFCFSLPHRTLIDPTIPDDWARAAGMWCGTYVFLHWEDLVTFNANPEGVRASLENGPEACGGLMKLELKLDMRLKDDLRLQTKLPTCDDLQPLYFSGISRSYDFQMATGVRGMCCLAAGGKEVRWRYIVHYSGLDQWQLEGVQPGGIRSGAVYGTWTSCAHEDEGPVGPFCYAPEELFKPTSVVLVA